MDVANPAIRRLCIAAALDQADGRGCGGPMGSPRLSMVINDACRDSLLERALWHRRPQGGGELGLMPPGVDEGYIIGHFTREAAWALRAYNRGVEEDSRGRLRVAFHQGLTYVADSGHAGPAVTLICSLLDSQPLADALLDNPGADLAVIVSQQIFEEVILQDGDDLRAGEFAPVQIAKPGEDRLTAWVRVASPGYPPAEELQRMREAK